jgi:hypothetical protein
VSLKTSGDHCNPSSSIVSLKTSGDHPPYPLAL